MYFAYFRLCSIYNELLYISGEVSLPIAEVYIPEPHTVSESPCTSRHELMRLREEQSFMHGVCKVVKEYFPFMSQQSCGS